MPEILSGPRQARSTVTPNGANVVAAVLDFNFAADQGIEISAILGTGLVTDQNPTPSDTAVTAVRGAQSLHLEEGTIEDIPIIAGEDEVQIDTEVFFAQEFGGSFMVGSTNTFGGGGNSTPGNLYVEYRDPVLVARNITHRGETIATGLDGVFHLLIFYRYVRFSLAELGLVLARRS